MAHDKTLQASTLESNVVESQILAFLEPLGQSLGKGVLILDTDLNVVTHNAAALIHSNVPTDLYKSGRSSKNILEFAIKRGDYGPDADIDALWNNILKRSAARKVSTEDVIRTSSNGRVIHAQRTYAEDGSAIVLSEDITDRKRREQLMDLAINSAGAGYWQFSLRTGKFTFSDSIREHLSKAELDRVHKDGFWPLIHPNDLPKVKANWDKAFKSKTIMDFSYRLVLEQSGTTYKRNIGVPIFAENGKAIGVNCLVLDQTEDRGSIRALKRRASEAERMVKAQNAYLANMSHEIRTPMNGVLGMTEALLQNQSASHITQELGIIRDSANMLLKLMDETLDHAKISADKLKLLPELSAPRKMLKDIKRLWVERAKSNNTQLNLNVLESVPDTLIIDPLRYHQCLNNLLSNAIKFTENGQVDIISTIVERGDKPFFVTAIRDTGIGMTQEQLADVFTPYQQATDSTSANYGGTGLGMSIVKQLAELMGGKVTAKSELGQGTTFALSFPLKRREGERRALPRATTVRRESMSDAIQPPAPRSSQPRTNVFAEERAPVDLSRLTVLVAEDNQINQLVVRSLLEPRIAEIVIVDNGQEAIEVLRNRHIDVILMDIHMPIMDGIEATIAIRNSQTSWANTKIIALTADPEYQQVRICRNIGMNYAIPKPLNFSDLITALETVFEDDAQTALQIA